MRTALLVALIVVLASAALADAKREYKTTATIGKLGSNTSTSNSLYSVDKHNAESTVQWTGGFMKTMTRGKAVESSVITRLDRDSVWTLDRAKKTYSVMSLAEYREQLKRGMAEAEQAEPEEDEPDSLATEDMYEWTVEDLSDTNPKEIGGWTCRNAHVVATGINKQDPNDKVIITVNAWNSEAVPGADEILAYSQRYLTALGLNDLALTEGLLSATYLYANRMSEVFEKAKEARGEPVQTLVKVEHNRLKGKSLGEVAKEGAADELAQKMPFGLGKKKKQDEKPEYVLKTIYSFEQTLLSANTDAIEASKFDVPDGYKLKK